MLHVQMNAGIYDQGLCSCGATRWDFRQLLWVGHVTLFSLVIIHWFRAQFVHRSSFPPGVAVYV